MGSKEFVERTKNELVISAQGRKVVDSGNIFQLRDPAVPYNLDFGTKNDDIGVENGYLWNENTDISIC